ncbi:MAG: TonB family protein, partial [Saprospiraceae bacterium]
MNLLAYLLQVTLGLAFFYAFYYGALRKETLFQTNRVYLIVTLLASIILPLVRIYILQLQEADIIAAPSIMYVGSYLDTMNIKVASQKQHIPWTTILLIIYLSGILLLFLRMMREIFVILRMKRYGVQLDIDHHQCILAKDVESPFSFFSTMYLPADHQFTEIELAEIIAHEKAHITGGHTMDVLFMELACIALWPSPMIYLYRKKLREVHEFLADAAVLKDTPWENYASFLVAQKVNGLQSRLTNQLIYSQLKNRLKMMTQQRSGFFARFKYLGLIPILLISLVIFSFREKTTETSGIPVDEHPIYNIYKDGLPVYVAWDSIILTVTKDKKYFLNSVQVPISQLEQKLKEASHSGLNPYVYLHIVDKTFTVGELSEIMKIIQKLNLSCVLETPVGHAETKRADTTIPNRDSCILVITADKRYFLNHKEIKNEYLEQALTKAVNKNLERTLYIYPPKDLKVGDVDRFFNLEIELNARFIYIIPELNPDRVYYQAKDTVTTTVITAFNLNENPIEEDKSYKNYVDFKTDDRAALPGSNSSYWYAGSEVYNPSGKLPDHAFVDEMPHFPGSSEDMFNFIYQSIRYPQEDREKGNEGLVIVQFIVEPDGSISNAKIVKGISPGLNNEALRVINSMNDMPEKWIPGIYEGKAAPVVFTFPFKFVLQSTPHQETSKPVENLKTSLDNEVQKTTMQWTHVDTSLVFDSETHKDEIIVTRTNPSIVSNTLEIEFSKN